MRVDFGAASTLWRLNDHSQAAVADVPLTIDHLTPLVKQSCPFGLIVRERYSRSNVPEATELFQTGEPVTRVVYAVAVRYTPRLAIPSMHPVLAVHDTEVADADIRVSVFTYQPVPV